MGTVLVTFREMRFLFVACLAVTVSAAPQANFGKKIEVNERLGLLANDLGLDPTAETSQSAALTAETSAGASGQLPSGRVPGGEEIGEPAGESQCCCVPQDEQCDDPFAGEDLVGLGLIDPRKKPLNSINTRIVNRPGSGSSAPQLSSCPVGQKTCAIIPNDSSNNNNVATRKVVTAAHKLKSLEQTDLLKVRVGEYDASG